MTRAFVLQGDCLEVLRKLPAESIDAVVTDPPYGLSSEPDMVEVLRHWCAAELREHAAKIVGAGAASMLFPEAAYTHGGGGFMGKTWDSFVPGPDVWREVLRVLKPGGHALVFSGTRTYDLTVLAMRIAGFEIRDQLAWMYGSGFPKSLDVSKAIDASLGAEREVIGYDAAKAVQQTPKRGTQALGDFAGNAGDITAPATPEAAAWSGWGTALKPAQEPIVLARKPFPKGVTVAANVLAHGTGAINVDGCRIEGAKPDTTRGAGGQHGMTSPRGAQGRIVDDGAGRWPANVIMDEAAAAALDEQTGAVLGQQGRAKTDGSEQTRTVFSSGRNYRSGNPDPRGDTGGASRFFYCAKTSRAEREAGLDHLPKRSAGELTDRTDGSDGLKSPRAGAGRTSDGRANVHPTVKPIALMRWLVRLVTPPGGVVLDPYCGSGSTLCAAVQENVGAAIGIELTAEYVPIIEGRVAHWQAQAATALNDALRGVFPDMSDAGGSYQ